MDEIGLLLNDLRIAAFGGSWTELAREKRLTSAAW